MRGFIHEKFLFSQLSEEMKFFTILLVSLMAFACVNADFETFLESKFSKKLQSIGKGFNENFICTQEKSIENKEVIAT